MLKPSRMRGHALRIGALLAFGTASGGDAFAQASYPLKAIRVYVPSAAGGAMDTTTRMVTLKLGDAVGQTVIVDNCGGANGAIAA